MKQFAVVLLWVVCYVGYAQKSDFSHVDFAKADSIAMVYKNTSLQNMPLLVHNLTHSLNTQVERFRAIHTWVCYTIESDHYFSAATLKKRRKLQNNPTALQQWNMKQQAKVYKRLVKDKKTICSGYAYILKTLTNLADIECEIVDGYARNVSANVNTLGIPNHSWNVVKLNGKWYFADTTQASGYYDLNEAQFIKNYNDGYFLAAPELFAKNHYPLDKKWLLLNEKPSVQQFVKAPIIYVDAYRYEVVPMLPKALITTINKGDNVVFEFKILNPLFLESINLKINDGSIYKKIKETARSFFNGVLAITYQFDKKGQFDVHAKAGDTIIVSHTINVVDVKHIKTRDM